MTPRSVLVTGAARGLGLALAEQFAGAGWEVLAPPRSLLDVADPASIARYAATLGDRPLDLLVNNAGVRLVEGASDLGDFDAGAWQMMLAVNVVGPALVTQAVLGHLRRGRGRTILSMSSRLGSLTAGGGANSGGGAGSYCGYRVSKTALNQLTLCLAAQLAPEGFTCVAISPGWLRTDMGGSAAATPPAEAARRIVQLAGRLSPDRNGSFLDTDGNPVPW